jgi:hypothetical protein
MIARRSLAAAVTASAIAVTCAVFPTSASAARKVKVPKRTATTAVAATTITDPVFTTGGPADRSTGSCVVDVTAYVARLSSAGNDTAAFTAAMSDAVALNPACYSAGPSGAPQAVVYVPAGTYRLAGLLFPSNVRMEVDAAATLQLPANRPAVPSATWTPMIVWDTTRNGQPAVSNVTLTGVGSNLDSRKSAAALAGGPALALFDLSHDFTMNLDPATSGSTNYNPGMNIANAQYFLIQNFFSIQNSSVAAGDPMAVFPWPTSGRAVLELHARKDSPIAGPFIQPKHGVISNHVNINSPRGFGPNQINAGEDLTFQNIYSSGGTALRLETDGSMNTNGTPDRGAKIDHLVARNIVGQNCNRAVSLSPHAQANFNVDVSGVWAYSCYQGVVAAVDNSIPATLAGRFSNATVNNLHVLGGTAAQLDSTVGLWDVGTSQAPVRLIAGLTWVPQITVVEAAGAFTKP